MGVHNLHRIILGKRGGYGNSELSEGKFIGMHGKFVQVLNMCAEQTSKLIS